MKRVFILGLTFIVVLSASLGLFLFISLWPYFTIIGKFAAGVVIVGLLCIATLLVSFTYNRIGIWNARRRREHLLARVIAVGDVVATVVDGTLIHLSAEHERAKVPLPQMTLPSPAKTEPEITPDETILELFNRGVSLRNIAAATGETYYRVQKVTAGKE